MHKEKLDYIKKYIKDFFELRIESYRAFRSSEEENKKLGIYRLKRGDELLQYLNNIMESIEENIYVENLIPQVFPNVKKFIDSLAQFKNLLLSGQVILNLNNIGENTSYVIHKIQTMKSDLIDLVDEVTLIWESEAETRIPYLELRHSLLTKDINSFYKDMNSILASVSYAITKVHEGYLHSNIHLILKLLGFEIISEEETNVGRIDAVLRFSKIIYIFEFKLGTAKEAMDQIRTKRYWEKFVSEKKEIILVGIGFCEEKRNISEFITDKP